jgi:hypothetical protein
MVPNAQQAPTIPAELVGDGSFPLEIVGEARYQDALDGICGGRTRKGHSLGIPALLVLEDANPKDPLAVRVDISGQTVGHLARDNARIYRERLAAIGQVQPALMCHAWIRGGWDRGGKDVGHYGVRLNVNISATPSPPRILATAPKPSGLESVLRLVGIGVVLVVMGLTLVCALAASGALNGATAEKPAQTNNE